MTIDAARPTPSDISSPFGPVETRLRLLERQLLAEPQGRLADLASQTNRALDAQKKLEEEEKERKEAEGERDGEEERIRASFLSEDGEGAKALTRDQSVLAPIPDSSPSRPKVVEEPPLIDQVKALQLKAQQHMHQRQVLVNFWKTCKLKRKREGEREQSE